MPLSDSRTILNSVSGDLCDEEIMLSGLQGVIAAEISTRRQERGLTQTQLADIMGVTQGLVSRWEKGETNFTLQTLVSIAKTLDIDMQSPLASISPRKPHE